MKKLAFALLVFASCTKSATNNTQAAFISYTFADNKRTAELRDTLSDGRFLARVGGNDTYDTTHGYVLSAGLLMCEVPKIATGTYSYKAFSPAWPHPLRFFEWQYWDGTLLQPDSASVTLNISRYSNQTADGTFSVNFVNGAYYVRVTKGVFTNLPVTN